MLSLISAFSTERVLPIMFAKKENSFVLDEIWISFVAVVAIISRPFSVVKMKPFSVSVSPAKSGASKFIKTPNIPIICARESSLTSSSSSARKLLICDARFFMSTTINSLSAKVIYILLLIRLILSFAPNKSASMFP